MSQPRSRYTFVLGSGVSCAAGLPDVQKLSCSATSAVSPADARLLEAIRKLVAATHGDGKDSYEDCVFVATQLFEHESGEFENPAVLCLMEQLRCSLHINNEEIMETAERLSSTIAKQICRVLSTTADARSDNAFAGLAEAIAQRPSAQLRFFSLNHDLLLESWLTNMAPYTALEAHPESPAFKRVRFCTDRFRTAPVSVIKLHGSVNWRAFRPHRSRGTRNTEFVGVAVNTDDDRTFELIDDVPRILMGTFNKVFRYSTPVFLPLFAAFQSVLRDCDCLVVCGYGFGDKGVNSLLIDWMYSKNDARLIVVDPTPFNPDRCRPAVIRNCGTWQNEGKLEVHARALGANDMTWAEILEDVDAR